MIRPASTPASSSQQDAQMGSTEGYHQGSMIANPVSPHNPNDANSGPMSTAPPPRPRYGRTHGALRPTSAASFDRAKWHPPMPGSQVSCVRNSLCRIAVDTSRDLHIKMNMCTFGIRCYSVSCLTRTKDAPPGFPMRPFLSRTQGTLLITSAFMHPCWCFELRCVHLCPVGESLKRHFHTWRCIVYILCTFCFCVASFVILFYASATLPSIPTK